MAKIANALTISEIEQILYAKNPHYETRSWNAEGVECRRDRHRYSGQAYEFPIDIFTAAVHSAWPGFLAGFDRYRALVGRCFQDPDPRREMAQARDRQVLGCARLGSSFSTAECGMNRAFPRRYALKHDGLRRFLASEEETSAADRALLMLAGHRTVNTP
jgi:hypothetical protein